MASPPYIVALAGPPGSGKTALMMALAERLLGAGWLAMDGFPIPAAMTAEALSEWVENGADFGRFEVPELAAALGELKAGRDVVDPETGRKVAAAPLMLIEMPLGRRHPAVAPMIDFLVWIDTPLDVALARNLLAWEAGPEQRPRQWTIGYLRHYLEVTRRVLVAQRAAVMPGAELVLDGLADTAALAGQVIRALGPRSGLAR